ncbi:MAG: hypothetical protein KDC98_00380, partial [Planctomycetes bacterium]|nr:hypothetical protein [Planctomycetota bacterium]
HHGAKVAAAFAAMRPITGEADLAAPAAALELLGRPMRAAHWVVERAREGLPPWRFVAGIVQVARNLGDEVMWGEVAELIERMAAVGRQQPRSRSAC